MGYAEDKFFDYLRNNLKKLNCLNINEMLNHLRGVFTLSTGEQLERYLDRTGNRNTMFNFLSDLQKRSDWVNHFLRALWECEQYELFYALREVYKSYRPSKVWEPDSPCHSLPPVPPNHYEFPQPDSPQRCASLPPEAGHSFPKAQPVPPAAQSPSRAEPEQVSRLSHQPQERSDPSNQPSAPLPHNPPPLPDQVDNVTSGVGISKKPVPESSPCPPPLVESKIETANPPEHISSPASSLPARKDIAMAQPLQEKSENPQVTQQQKSIVNSPRKDAINELPRAPVYQDVAGSDVPNRSSSPTSSMHKENKAWVAPQQRELPSHSQGTSNPPAGQHYGTNDSYKHQPEESAPNLVTNSPSQRLSMLNLEHEANAGLGQRDREQPTYPQRVQPSSCRPTNDDTPWDLGKPGVLVSNAAFADVTGDINQVQPLSREPILEISDDESSNGNSQSSGSSQPPAPMAGNRSPPQWEVPTTSTSKKLSFRRSPRKNPEENEEPMWGSSPARGRPPNASSSQVAEENSFDLSNESYYRLHFNEEPSVDLMDKNNASHQRSKKPSGTRDTSGGAASQEKEKPRNSNLHDPVVITLSAVVVCLSIYIIWLKTKK